MTQRVNEMASIVVRDNGNHHIASRPRKRHHRQKSASPIIRGTGGHKKHTRREGKGQGCRQDQSTASPGSKKAEHGGQSLMLKVSLEISRSCPSCHSKCEISPNHRSCGCHRRVLVPRITVSGGQDGGQNVGTR